MLTGFETKKVIVGRPGAGVDDTAADRLGQRFTPACASPNRLMSRLPAATHALQTRAKQGGGF